MALGLMCVHAHPDDEAISTGGVLLKAAAEGLRTAVVTCTGGEMGEIVGAGLDPEAVRPRLGELRLQELTEALTLLGAGAPRLLGYRDSDMIGREGNDDPRCFWRAPFDEAVGRLVAQIRDFRPDVLVGYDAFGLYGHPDHIQTHRVGVIAAEAAAVEHLYPEAGQQWRVRKVYLATVPASFTLKVTEGLVSRGLPSPFADADPGSVPFGSPDDTVTTLVDVREFLDRKMAALRKHHSQLGADSFFLNMPEDLQEVAFGSEAFILHRSDVGLRAPEDDLFAGLRPAAPPVTGDDSGSVHVP